jgi:DNA (cytosine-5)-methyltransferase 1
VDHLPQKNYPFTFVQADALEFLTGHWEEFDLIHASPPCQAFSSLRHLSSKTYPNLQEPTLEILRQIPRPYIVENVEGAACSDAKSPDPLWGTVWPTNIPRSRF